MKKKTFVVYSDSGHAWVKAKFLDLVKLNIQDKITPYSYTRGEYVYLEEDLDASTFVSALRNKGIEPVWKQQYTNKQSKIRSYERYTKPIEFNGSYFRLV